MRWLRSLFALVVSVVLLGGLPLLLLKVVGNPWSGVRAMFTTGTMTDTGVLDVLAVIVIGAAAVGWLQFTAAFITEFTSVRRAVKYGHRTTRPQRVPFVLKSQSRLAHSLVTALLLLGPVLFSAVGPSIAAAAAAVPPAPAAVSAALHVTPDQTPRATSPAASVSSSTTKASTTTSVTLTSNGPRTWWDLAEHYLGAGDRWQNLWTLNQGHAQRDGTVLDSPLTALRPGWNIAVPAWSVAISPTAHSNAAAHPNAAASSRPAAAAHVVVHTGDTLSGIAQHELGNADLYPQLAQANHLADPDDIEAGQTITIPASLIAQQDAQIASAPAATGAHTVHIQPGDTLSGISQRELGNADLYSEIAATNHLADPDDIEAGSTLVIPAHASPAAPAAPATAGTTHPVPITRPTPAGHATTPIKPQTATPVTPPGHGTVLPTPAAAGTPVTTTAPVSGTPAPTTAAPTPAPAGHGAKSAAIGQNIQQPASSTTALPTHATESAQPATASESSSVTAIVGGIGAALGAALLAGLAVARRRKGRKRPIGEVPRPVSLPAARVERHLRERAGAADVAWMDTALRTAAALCAARPVDQLPDVTAVWLSKKELQLQLATAVPAPEPFLAEDTDWVLPVGVELVDRTETAAPFPGLVSLGESDGETFLVDLERIGALTVTGDKDRTADLLRHVAVEYAHSLWSDHLQVHLVGWGQPVTALRPDRLSYAASVANIVTLLRGRLHEAREIQADDATTILQARISDPDTVEDPWTPTILLIDAHADEDLEPLAEVLNGLNGAGRSAVAVVTRTDQVVAGSANASIDADGKLHLPGVLSNHLRVKAAGLTQAALDELLELFAAAGHFATPGPVSDTTEAWSTDMSVMGTLLPAPAASTLSADADSVAEAESTAPGSKEEDLDQASPVDQALPVVVDVHTELDRTTGPAGRVVPLRPELVEAQQMLAKVLSDDAGLDADLKEWWVDAPEDVDPEADKSWVRRPRIGVLGAPLVVARGRKPADRINRFTEMAVYLAIHREVDADQFAGDLWPTGDTPTGENRRSYVSRVRSWMGTDEGDGRNYLPSARLKPYRLERLLDIELFRRLRKRADAYLQADDRTRAVADLASALDLVRGPILENHPRTGYAWSTTNDEADIKDANLMMIEAAHLLVDLALDDDDFELARQAADVGYRVNRKADLPLVDHMRIAHQVGDDQKARGWLAALLEANEIELTEDIPNYKTFEAVSEVFPDGLPTAANN